MYPLVSICCLTYNHEPYITHCLEGFLMQKTNFPIEILIHDDASKDGTAEIIKEYENHYPDLIKPIFQKENQYSQGRAISSVYQFPRANGKYIAICEGDDYWIDPYKLQKQVDFLEGNPDYGMIHTAVQVVDFKNELILISNSPKPSGDVFYDLLLKSAFIVTCSVCVRSDLILEAVDYGLKGKLNCFYDYWYWLHLAIHSKIKYLPEITSAYRSHTGGVTKGGKSYFSKLSPLAVLDAISYKMVHFPERKFSKKWELYINYCRALTASALSWNDRKKYFKFLLHKPIYFLAFMPAFWRKIKLRFSKHKP